MKFLRKIIENGGWVCFFTALLSLSLHAAIEFKVGYADHVWLQGSDLIVYIYRFTGLIFMLMPYFYLLIVMPLKFFIDKRSFSNTGKKLDLILWIVLVLIILSITAVFISYSLQMMKV